MVTINFTFTCLADAEAFVARYLADFHPCGYGTRLYILQADDGTVVVTGSRSRSCD